MKFVHESVIPASVEAVFAFHERPDAFALLQPPWERTEILQPPSSLEVGTEVVLRTKVGPLWVGIEAEHVAYDENVEFADVMRRGPFAAWHHRHLFYAVAGGCRLRDEIEYTPPLGILGRWMAPVAVVPRLQKMFAYRHDVTRREVLASTDMAA